MYDVFSDESRHTEGRFRCIAAISLPADNVVPLEIRLSKILELANLKELMWKELRGPKRLNCASRFLDIILEQVLSAELRLDAVIWDTEDSRHTVENRDDIRNYERMFFHLHRALMCQRKDSAEWNLRPDEQVLIDWETLDSCLRSDGSWRAGVAHPFLSDEFKVLTPRLLTFQQVKSEERPLCQAADLFAGMAPYTRDRAEFILDQLVVHSGQANLFRKPIGQKPSKKDLGRFPLIKKLYDEGKQNSLGVSLASRGYLITKDPTQPINFWHYEPQHVYDKAPVRNG